MYSLRLFVFVSVEMKVRDRPCKALLSPNRSPALPVESFSSALRLAQADP